MTGQPASASELSSWLSASLNAQTRSTGIFVVVVSDRGGEQLGQDRAELDGLIGQSLRRLPHRRVLQIAGAKRPDDARQHARFELVVQDVAARR